MAASCCVWLDDASGVALVEPVGCRREHRRRGLASAVSLAALHAARGLGGTTGLVRPRGDSDYPGPGRLYRGIGFVPGPRTRTWARSS
jgi:GNAT superfamily N-acetyltransferase